MFGTDIVCLGSTLFETDTVCVGQTLFDTDTFDKSSGYGWCSDIGVVTCYCPIVWMAVHTECILHCLIVPMSRPAVSLYCIVV